MSLRFAALLLLFSVATIAAEVPVSSPVYIGAAGRRFAPRAATDGENFLVAWADGRGPGIFATRVAADGTMLDLPTGIRLGDGGYEPLPVWTGSMYLVAWGVDVDLLRLARIDRDGHLLSTTDLGGDGVTWHAAAISTGNGALFALMGPGDSVTLLRLDDKGESPQTVLLSPSGADVAPSVATNGRGFVAAWLHRTSVGTYKIVTAPVSNDLRVGPNRTMSGNLPAVASNGVDYLLAYIDENGKLVTEHIDVDGTTVLSHTVLPDLVARFSVAISDEDRLSIAPDGNGYVITLPPRQSPSNQLPACRVDRNGNFLGALNVTPGGTATETVTFASNGPTTMAAYADQRDGYRYVFARPLSAAATGETLLSRVARSQNLSSVASDGDGALAVWREWDGIDWQEALIFAGRVLPGGTIPDGQGIFLGRGFGAATVFDGRNYVVAWITRFPDSVAYVRIAPDGKVLDDPPRIAAYPADGATLGLGTNGHQSLIVFGANGKMSMALIAQDGSIATPRWLADAAKATVSITSNGSSWLLAWEQYHPLGYPPHGFYPTPPQYNVYATLLTTGLDAIPVAIARDTSRDQRFPSVASNGSDFVVSWAAVATDPVDAYGTKPSSILAQRIDASGNAAPARNFTSGTKPSVAARNGDYVVTWIDKSDFLVTSFSAPSLRFPIAPFAEASSHIALLPNLAAYDRTAFEPVFGTARRVFVDFFQQPVRNRPTKRP